MAEHDLSDVDDALQYAVDDGKPFLDANPARDWSVGDTVRLPDGTRRTVVWVDRMRSGTWIKVSPTAS